MCHGFVVYFIRILRAGRRSTMIFLFTIGALVVQRYTFAGSRLIVSDAGCIMNVSKVGPQSQLAAGVTFELVICQYLYNNECCDL